MKKIYIPGARSQIARHNTIRDINRQIVLNFIRVHSPISRAEIARETSLQRSTISAIVEDLTQEGFVEDIGTGTSTGGRKPTLLRLKTGTPVALGVDVTPRETTIALADLAGNLLETERFPTSSDIRYMNEQILGKVSKFAASYPNAELRVGISIPGIADPSSNTIAYIPYFQWTNWDIGKQIEEKTGLPVTIDNDANAVALAELWFGDGQISKTHNFITILVAEGIGTGIIIKGEVYRGEFGAAGEFGHMYVGEGAPVECSCGRRDCWEAHASEKAMISRYLNGRESVAKGNVDMEQIINLALNGESRAIETLKSSAKSLGIGISSLIVGFSPQAVVISGSIVRAWDIVKEDLQILADRSIRTELASPAIVPSTLGDEPTILGSIGLILAKKFAAGS
ncbi:MAG: ROK family transcriptional regulator [Acidobacteria bacterium]|nr:ROK family transcriptional regulator [Acidobacteriota bacterium]